MAKAHVNRFLNGLSGTIDDHVFRRHRGKTILQRKPTFTLPRTEAQVATMKTFSEGSKFAALVKADPDLRRRYATRGRKVKLNFRHMAIGDYFHAPTVEHFDADRYTAAGGGTLTIVAADDFEVVRVAVTLHDADDRVVASGDAVGQRDVWQFEVAPPVGGAKPPVRATVTACDRPGNATTEEFPLPV